MKRALEDGFELDDDPRRVDLEAVWQYLSTEAYWGRDRSKEDVTHQIREAARVVGLSTGPGRSRARAERRASRLGE